MDNLREIVRKEYGRSIDHTQKLDVGFDKNTAIYKLFSYTHETFFLKIRTGNFNETCITIPFWLSKVMNLPNIINPIKTLDNKLFVKAPSCYLMLFPYINGQSGWDSSLTKDQFLEFGKFMYNLHSIKLPDKYSSKITVETYSSKYRDAVKEIITKRSNRSYDNNVIIDFLMVLQQHQKIIIEMIEYLERITKEIKDESHNLCLCHGDIHAGNILINGNDFYIVDWDTILMAPKEKDLMFIGGGIGNKWNKKEEIEYFYEGYGQKFEIDNNLIKYYRYERIIQDIYEFYQQVMNINTEDEERKLCFELFKSQFEPNNVIDTALRT